MPLRICLGWHDETCRERTPNPRCPRHDAMRKRASNARHRPHRERRPGYGAAERRRRADAVTQWRDEHGDMCPGYQRPPHPASDLTADHVISVASGGREDGPLVVLCRSCNSRKGAR